jgi:hypothetical protein
MKAILKTPQAPSSSSGEPVLWWHWVIFSIYILIYGFVWVCAALLGLGITLFVLGASLQLLKLIFQSLHIIH